MTRFDTITNDYKANSIWQLKNKLYTYENLKANLFYVD